MGAPGIRFTQYIRDHLKIEVDQDVLITALVEDNGTSSINIKKARN
jgi:hypothetical protein